MSIKLTPQSKSSSSIVGRKWLFRTIYDHFQSQLPTSGGFVVTGGAGTGKTTVLKELIQGGKEDQFNFLLPLASQNSFNELLKTEP